MLKQQENRELPSMEAESINSQMSDFSDREYGSHTGNSFNGFDHQQAYHINNANKSDMLNHELEFDSYQKRLQTFERWPADSPVRPEDLAAAGFYSKGLDDRVECFKCDLNLRQWNAGDNPWNEHKQYRPQCPFLREGENAKGYKITCRPVEASSNVQELSQPSFTQAFPRYGDGTYVNEHEGPLYPERPQYATVGGGGYGNEEKTYHPVDIQTGSQQVYYPGRTREFLGKDPRSVEYQRPEHEQIDRNRHVVVRQGSSQVHIVGPAAYRLNPEDKLYIQGGGQGYPPHVRSERELMPVYPEAHQTSHYPSVETSFTGSHSAAKESIQYSSEVPMSGRNQFPQSTISYPPSYTGSYNGQFAKQQGYQHPIEKSSSSQNAEAFQERWINAKYVMQPCREGDKMEYSRDKLHETRPTMQPYVAERKTSNEKEPLHENSYPQRYPGSNSERDTTGMRPSQAPQDRSRQPGSPICTGQGSRRPPPAFAAFPVKDPSLQTAQRPLIRNEEARHVTSSADLSNEHHRLTTFVDWPHDHHIRPWDLAAAGFYYLGTGDSVKCYKCGIPLHNWEPTDTPWGEHKKWAPVCPLVLEQFSGRAHQVPRQSSAPEQPVPSAREEPQNWRPEQSQGPNDRQVPFRSGVPPPVHGTWGASEQFPARKVSNEAVMRNPSTEQQHSPWYTQAMTTSSEEGHMTSGRPTCSTGESGSRTSSETPQGPHSCSPRGSTVIEFDMDKLGEMGFTQQEIREVIAFQLETTGSNFNTFHELVSALLEKQQTRSSCCESFSQPTPQEGEGPPSPPRLTMPLGLTCPRENEDVRERNCLSAVTSPTTPVLNKSSLRRSLSEPASRSSETEESLEEKLERMQEERTCKICMDAEVGVVFLPCGHFSCCADCANGMDLCPMCRTPIHEKIRTYLS